MKTKLALLAHRLGSIEALAELLGVDAELLELYFSGAEITDRQLATIERADADLRIGTVFEDNDIDIEEIKRRSKKIDTGLRVSELTPESRDVIIKQIADGNIEDDFLRGDEATNTGIFPFLYELTLWQAERIVEWLQESPENSINDFMDYYLEDSLRRGGIHDDFETSLFWTWFRETMYGDAT